MRILVGDIGGTKTVLAVARPDGSALTLEAVARYPSADFPNLETLLARHRADTGADCRHAAFAIAGPVAGRRCELTNLDWHLDADALETALGGGARVALLNDLEAVAWGLAALRPDELAVLHPGAPGAVGNIGVIAAGTGLGQAGLYWDGRRHHPFATEGGHTDFAPADDRDQALWNWLHARFGHVSWERLVSGQGLVHLHAVLCASRGEPVPDWLLAADDRAAAIGAAARAGRCPVCAAALDWLLRLYGREAGNLALKLMARGGIYLGGGIAPRYLDALRGGGFLDEFFAKGRMAPLLRELPVRVILNARVALLGAARFLLEAG